MTRRFSVYLLREILPFYGAGLAALVLLLLGAFLLEVLADVLARGAPLNLVARFLLYSLPEAAGYGIPLALLFAALLGLTRLGQDSEIKASLLLGLSPAAFLMPLATLGVVVSLLSFVNNEVVVPWSNRQALEAQKDILIHSPETLVEEGTFFTDALGRSVYIDSIEPGGVFAGITVIQTGAGQATREVISADRGVLDEAAGVWRLQGTRLIRYEQSRVVLEATAESGLLPVRGLAAAGATTPELTRLPIRELLARIEGGSGRAVAAEWTALHRKFSEPLAATAFALFALAVGLYSFRSNLSLGLVSVLFLTFVYYATWSISNLLGAQGTIPAFVAGWAPVGLYAGAGIILLTATWRR